MFDKTSRSIYEEGLRFYEEDVLFDSHLYTAHQKVVLELEYLTNGVGLIIGLIPGKPLAEQTLYYFVRIDYCSASLFLVNQMHYERLEHVSTPIAAPLDKLKIEVTVLPNQIILALNDYTYLYASIDYSIGEHHLALYSQKNNTFHRMTIEGKAPSIWRVNMQGAQNGRISFERNQVRFSECKYPAELLQENIELEAGEYYLHYEGEGVTLYAFATVSSFVDLKDKNLLDANNHFVLEEPTTVAIYFSGQNGYLKNLSLSRLEQAPYIETYQQPLIKESSYLKVKTAHLQKVRIDFVVRAECFGTILSDETATFRRGLICGEHRVVLENGLLTLYYGDRVLDEKPYYGTSIELFRNLELYIYHIEITDDENKVTDWFRKTDKEDWIKPSLNSPILATNETGEPLDLSASFRKINGRYVFTTTERETFKPYPLIKLSEPIETLVGVYGIPKSAVVDEAAFYTGAPENINDLTAYCQTFEPIITCTFDSLLNQVVFYEDLTRYQEIIIDYKKKNSYAINFINELGKYKLETTADHYSYFYSLDGQEQYAQTIYKEKENYYIVLDKGDNYEN